jgi:two-component system, chemotaxis family, chemotaxis protein CheY
MTAYDISALNVLVLEKHILVRQLLTDVFREFGVPTVHSTPEPSKAWDIFETSPIDIILSDWTHGLDGMAFLRKLRQDENSPNPYVPVIVITANTELSHVLTARDTGTTEFLAKPISAKQLYTRIVSVIESNRPFIRASSFFGPDRRRRRSAEFLESERRKSMVA